MINMFPLLTCSALLPLLFLAAVSAQTDSNQTVSAIDSRITYNGDGWTVQDNGGHEFTSFAGSLALDFTGVAVYWFSRRLYNGATVMVMLDSEEAVYVDLSAGTTQNDTTVPEVLYSKEGLSDSSHHLNITWDGIGSNGVGTFLENYRILFSGSSSGSTSSSASPTSTTSSSSKSSSNVGAIAGGVIGAVVVGVILFVTVFFCLRRRKSRAAALQEFQSATPFSPQDQRSEMRSTSYSSLFSKSSPVENPRPVQPQLPMLKQRIVPQSYNVNSQNSASLLSPGESASSREPITPSRRLFPFASSWRSRADSGSHTLTTTSQMNGATMVRPSQPSRLSGSSHYGVVEDPPPVYDS